MPRVPRPAPEDNDPHSLRLEKVIALDAVEVSNEDILRARRAYLANVSYVDEWLGRLRAALEETGQAEDTAILFVADHGDMLGERGLWYKMSFYEWSVRVPMILMTPGREGGQVVNTPVSQVDVLPTLMRLAHDGTGAPLPDLVDTLDGEDLLAVSEGGHRTNPHVMAEYLAEGTGQPLLMIREGSMKYTCCPGDPEQLFDLANDPDELNNLADEPAQAEVLARMRQAAAEHWDAEEVRQKVLESQRRRRILTVALETGKREHWDWTPKRDSSEEYTRSHMDLTQHDIASRWPRPPAFEPKWK